VLHFGLFSLRTAAAKPEGGEQEPKTRAAAPSALPDSSKASHGTPASPARRQQGCHTPTKSSQPPRMIATQRDRPPGPIWTSGNTTTTPGTMFPSLEGSGMGKTQAPTSLEASAREGCWHRQPEPALSNSGDERGREKQRKKSLSYLLQSHRPPPLLALRDGGAGEQWEQGEEEEGRCETERKRNPS